MFMLTVLLEFTWSNLFICQMEKLRPKERQRFVQDKVRTGECLSDTSTGLFIPCQGQAQCQVLGYMEK